MGTFVLVVIDDDGTRRYFTGLRYADGTRYLPTHPLDERVLRYDTRASAVMDLAGLRGDGLVAESRDLFWERPYDVPPRAPQEVTA